MMLYLAGPMRGIKDFNFPLFLKVAYKLRKKGHVVFNPAEWDIKKYGAFFFKSEKGDIKKLKGNFDLRQALLEDVSFICSKADGIVMLPGWRKSKGATAERALARALGLKIINWNKNA